MSPLQNKSGTLTRANKLTLGEPKIHVSVSSLQYWSDSYKVSSCDFKLKRHRHESKISKRTRLVGFKIQETVLNFLLRWLVTDESARQDQQRVSFKTVTDVVRSDPRPRYVRQRRKTRSSLLLTNVENLSDRRFKTVLKFVFWRWLTVTNLIELLLIVFLVGCCVYQCYELLEEYYQYPTHVSMRKTMNDDFEQDLPALTFCNNNRISKETVERNFPHLNDTHFIAITQGTFYSVDNFTVDMNRTIDFGYLPEKDDPFSKRMEMTEMEKYIDWNIVGPFLANNTIVGMFNMLPDYDIVDTVTCATIWGEQLPCQKLKRIETIQEEASCRTLFHKAAFWDSQDPAVQELEIALKNQPDQIGFGKYGSITSGALLQDGMDEETNQNSNDEGSFTTTEGGSISGRRQSLNKHEQDEDETRVRVEVSHMEVLRVRLDFRRNDYKNKRLLIGGKLSIHPNSALGSRTVSHIGYNIRPGFWYNYYIQRFDYRYLPPPYSTKCYEYQEMSQRKMTVSESQVKELNELMRRQLESPGKLIERYGEVLRLRSLGGVSKHWPGYRVCGVLIYGSNRILRSLC